MREERKIMKNRLVWFFAFFFAVLLIFFCAGRAKAAPNRIMFNDGSGKYLHYSQNRWVLKDKSGKPLTGFQYLSIQPRAGWTSGYYAFDSKGCVLKRRAIYKCTNRKMNNVVFDGYYYVSSVTGRLAYNPSGLVYFSKMKCGDQVFDGYYYVDALGKLSTKGVRVRYLNKTKVNGVTFQEGYYFFNSTGRMLRGTCFRKVTNQKVGNISFNGEYLFNPSGMLHTKAGLIVMDGKKYYVTNEGKKVTNSWVNSFYFLSDGTMAISMQVPDGSWVDSEGRRLPSSEVKLYPLRAKLESMIKGYSGTWSVYVKNLKTNDTITINNQVMYPASTIKAFAMAEAFDLVNQGRLPLTDELQRQLYLMITESDNDAFNQIVSAFGSGDFLAGAQVLNTYLKKNGYNGTQLHHTAKPAMNAFITDGGTNAGTAKDCGLLLERIYKGQCVNAKYSASMMNLLVNQKRRWKIPAALPPTAIIGNKTGETEEVQHDIAIVSGPKTDFVICVYSISSETAGIAGIKAIAREVWNYLE